MLGWTNQSQALGRRVARGGSRPSLLGLHVVRAPEDGGRVYLIDNEFVNPHFGEGGDNRVFRAYRYSVEEIARAKKPGGLPEIGRPREP